MNWDGLTSRSGPILGVGVTLLQQQVSFARGELTELWRRGEATFPMGKLVPFSSRQDQAQTEAILARAGELLQRRTRAREALPRVLALLSTAGHQQAVLQVIEAWGRGEAEPEELLEQCEKLAAVSGIDLDRDGMDRL